MRELIDAIRAKKGLRYLDDGFIRERVERILGADARIMRKWEARKSFAQFARSKEYESLLKAVRKELRVVYGVFQDGETRQVSPENLHTVLETHVSTRERLPFYDLIYKELAARIPAPKSVLDLGCGLNPLTQGMMARHGWRPEMIGVDISSADMAFLEGAMRTLGIPGRTITADLTKEEGMRALDGVQADVTLVLKLLDTLEETRRFVSYDLFDHIRSPWIVVSFPTTSLGGKRRISTKGRSWFERLLHRKALAWETFSVENELFYVIQR